jgi:tetratricopeptide (TPR) repeat protein
MNLTRQPVPNIWIFAGSIIIAFILYGNTLNNKYCLDDSIVILQNKYTQKGILGIGPIFTTESFAGFFGEQKNLVAGARYRPLSIATYAVEHAFFGENPRISHLLNILLYAFTAVLIYLLVKKIFVKHTNRSQYLALFTTLLFLFHPIHTEVIANIKGRDEILALFFSLLAAWFMLVYLEKKKGKYLFYGAFTYFLALLSKENAFAFLILIPIMLYLPGRQNFRLLIKPTVTLMGVGFLFFIIRQQVIGEISTVTSNELMNNSFLGASVNVKYATIFYTLGKYIQLLFFPHPLTFDYYPYHISLVSWASWYSIYSLIIYLVLIFLALYNFRKNYLITVVVSFYLIPLVIVSNLFFPIGTFMNERFVYISSLGFCLWVAYIGVCLLDYKVYRLIPIGLLSIILFLYGYKTISRNTAWYNDYTLFTTDVKTSVNSAKSNCSAGGVILESTDTITNATRKSKSLAESKKYLKKAVSIHPTYIDALLLLGNLYFKTGNAYDSAMYYYTDILKINPGNSLAIRNMIAVGDNLTDTDQKIDVYETVLINDPNNFAANYHLGVLFGKVKNNLKKAIGYLDKSVQLKPGSKEACIDLGVAYGLTGNFAKSAEALEKAIIIDSADPNVYINLGLSYQKLGNTEKARKCFEQAKKLGSLH